jgi:serine/threonine protein kinase
VGSSACRPLACAEKPKGIAEAKGKVVKRPKLSMDDFTLGPTVGTGSFSRVRVAQHKATGSVWALKLMKKAEIVRLQQTEHVQNERSLLSTLRHPFIVEYGGSFQGAYGRGVWNRPRWPHERGLQT